MRPEFEERLDDLREQAGSKGIVPARRRCCRRPDPALNPATTASGRQTAGLDLGNSAIFFRRRRRPEWRPSSPAPAFIFHQLDLARAAMWIAAIGAIISPILLDHGSRPSACFSSTCCAFSNIARRCRWAHGYFPCSARSRSRPGCVLELYANDSFASFGRPIRHSSSRCLSSAPPFWGMSWRLTPACFIGATAIPAWYLHRFSCRCISARRVSDLPRQYLSCSVFKSPALRARFCRRASKRCSGSGWKPTGTAGGSRPASGAPAG